MLFRSFTVFRPHVTWHLEVGRTLVGWGDDPGGVETTFEGPNASTGAMLGEEAESYILATIDDGAPYIY